MIDRVFNIPESVEQYTKVSCGEFFAYTQDLLYNFTDDVFILYERHNFSSEIVTLVQNKMGDVLYTFSIYNVQTRNGVFYILKNTMDDVMVFDDLSELWC